MPAWLSHDEPVEAPPLVAEPPPSSAYLLAKYFLHGLLLYVIFLVVSVLWFVLALALVICGFLLGLLVALVILVILYGWANSKVTRWLWFDVEEGWLVYLFHGLLLSLMALVAALPIAVAAVLWPWTGSGLVYNYLLFQGPFPQPIAFVVALGLNFILMGFFGRSAASLWERPPPPDVIAYEPDEAAEPPDE